MPTDRRHDRSNLFGVRHVVAAIEAPGAPQHARRDIETSIADFVKSYREINELCGLSVDFDGLAGGAIDLLDNIACQVAAELTLDAPGFIRRDAR